MDNQNIFHEELTENEFSNDRLPFILTQLNGSSKKIEKRKSKNVTFIYIRNGQASLFIENNCIKLNSHDFVLIYPNTFFHIDKSENDSVIIFKLPVKFVKEELYTVLKKNEKINYFLSPIVFDSANKIAYLYYKNNYSNNLDSFNNLFLEYTKKDNSPRPRILTFFLAILIEEISLHSQLITSSNLFPKENIDIQGIIDYIEQNLNTITLSDLAKHFHYNTSYLSTTFKKNTNMNFTDYVRNKKMEKAKDYLLHTDYSINKIARLLGYSDRSHFFQVFKAYYSVSPSDFKKENYLKKGKHPLKISLK